MSILLLMASFVLPASHGIPLGKRLLDEPESWGFIFNTPGRRLMGATEQQTKQLLLSYLRDHHSRDAELYRHASTGALRSNDDCRKPGMDQICSAQQDNHTPQGDLSLRALTPPADPTPLTESG